MQTNEHRQPIRSQLGNATVKLAEVFHGCDTRFRYDRSGNPRRILTKPGRPVHNSGYDNEKWDYILYVNDVIGEEEGRRYMIIDLLGQGTFGQVAKCQNLYTKELVAIKVIKNQPAYYNQSMMEVTVLEMLNNKYDREDQRHIVRLKDTFVFRSHLCIVVELLSVNLYELIKQNQYRGFSLKLCRIILAQVLDSLCVLKEAKIVHCDLKPENILLRSLDKPSVKVIDFGSACHEHQTVYTYIQSRFYRSPEVLLGLPYSASIDMWSLGCIAIELFLGLPIFPGASNYDQVGRIVESLGMPPFHMLEVGKDSLNYFDRVTSEDAQTGASLRPQYALKTRERYSLEQNRAEPPSKRYFTSTCLEEIIMSYPVKNEQGKEEEMKQRRSFLHFCKGLLTINPVERWSPMQAISHPFITGHVDLHPADLAGALPISSRARPRANTLATLSLQDVPGPLQKLAAAAQGSAAPPGGPTDIRSDYLDSSSASTKDNVAALEYSSYGSPGATVSSVNALSTQQKKPENYYTNRYVDNRRMSNPGLPTPTNAQSSELAPSSLPAWYNPRKGNSKRRDSVEISGSQAIPNSPLSRSPDQPGTQGKHLLKGRRKSMSSQSPMDSIDEVNE